MIFAFAFLVSTLTLQTAEKDRPVRFIMERITNHTDNDLFLVPIKNTPGNLIILKAHKTIKNIKLPVIQSEYDQEGIWSIENESNQKLRRLRYVLNYRGAGYPIEHIWVGWLLPVGLDLIDWQEEIDLNKYQALQIAISLDIKGDNLEDTEMDVKAVAK